MGLAFSVFISLISCLEIFHNFVIESDSVFFCDDSLLTGDRPCQALPALHLAVGVVWGHCTKAHVAP
jgi:hypothetical protein